MAVRADGAVVAVDLRFPTANPIALTGRRSRLYAALSGFSYVRYEWFARLAQLWCGGTLAHSPARESIVFPATKIPDVGQHEFVVVDYVKLVVRVSPEIHPIQGARATSHQCVFETNGRPLSD